MVKYDHVKYAETARWGIDVGAGSYQRIERAPADTQTGQADMGNTDGREEAVLAPFLGNEQYEANIFLSNFSEQFFDDFDQLTASEARVAAFAYLYSKINARDNLSYVMVDDVNYEAISLAAVNSVADRFFDLTLSPADGTDYSDELGYSAWARCYFNAGTFYFPFASGESYNRFSVVKERTLRPDGSYLLDFDVFALNIEDYFAEGMSSALYALSASEAEKWMQEGTITLVQKGYAVVYPYHLNGRDTYRLVSYRITD